MGGVAYYVRTSMIDREGEGQIAALKGVARQRGLSVEDSHWFIDRNQSSTKAKRPAMERLKSAAHRGEVTHVYVFALDRLGRSVTDLLGVLNHFITCGVPVVSLKEQLDFSTAAGRLQVHLLAAFAEFERERDRERSLAWVAYARKKGIALGRPVGRKLKLNAWAKRTAVQDDVVLALRKSGMSYSKIAAHTKLPMTTVYRIINPERARRRRVKVEGVI